MATKNNYKHVKAYEKRMIEEKGFYRQKVWLPNTQEARNEVKELARKLREKHLKKLGY